MARDEDDKAIERDLVASKMIDEKLEDGETKSREKEMHNQLESMLVKRFSIFALVSRFRLSIGATN